MKKHNYTLVEVFIVIAIVLILIGMVYPAIQNAYNKSNSCSKSIIPEKVLEKNNE